MDTWNVIDVCARISCSTIALEIFCSTGTGTCTKVPIPHLLNKNIYAEGMSDHIEA